MAITRRQFIKRTGLAAAGSFLGPSLFRNPLLREALASTIGDRYFVVVFLNGGNDGLNTIAPVADDVNPSHLKLRTFYQQARKVGSGGIQLPASGQGALVTPTLAMKDPTSQVQLGFHPGLAGPDGLSGLRGLYDLGKVAVIQGCGYPDYSLSHDISRTAWHSGNPLTVSTYPGGWVGRYLADNYVGSDIPGVNIEDSVADEFIQTTTSVLAVTRLRDFNFPYDDFDSADEALKKACFQTLHSAATGSAQPTLKYVGDTGNATLSATDSYPGLVNPYNARTKGSSTWTQAYSDLNTGFAKDLREIARVIYGVSTGAPSINARFFELSNGGYDTHSDQGKGLPGDQQYDLHRQVGDAINLFYQDCTAMGVQNKVVLMVFSEFSRRVEQNDSGTDHGSQAPVFVIGGGVTGTVYGNHPNIDNTDLGANSALGDDGNTVYWQGGANSNKWTKSTDFRDVYGTILNKWLGMTDPVLSLVLPKEDPMVYNPNYYWTAPNFNMGFL